MIEIRIDAPELNRLEQMPQRLHWALARFIAREAHEAAREMKTEMAQQHLAATSLLINSVQATELDPLTWRVGPHVAYARYLLEGRKPGGKMPPWRAILDWLKVKRLGFDRQTAWAVARAIQRRGIKPRDYLTPVGTRTAARVQSQGLAVVQSALGGGDVG